jgi:hypothetical protein
VKNKIDQRQKSSKIMRILIVDEVFGTAECGTADKGVARG